MSIKIHHGPPGSYKTSGAVYDDFVSAALDGRVIVTNVRGLQSGERVKKVLSGQAKKRLVKSMFPSMKRLGAISRHLVKGDFKRFWGHAKGYRKMRKIRLGKVEIINVDTSTSEGKEKMRRWFHWAPLGAFLIIDEINTIYPKTWTARKLEDYDFEGGEDAAEKEGRPYNATQALEMHRHYNYDLVLTTPNIRKVHDIFRQSAEMAYRHKNAATIGLPGRYWEYMHEAENDGRSKNDILIKASRKIPKWVFDLYSSTTTGKASDTKAGQSIFLRPGPIIVFIGLIGGIWVAVNRVGSIFDEGKELESVQETSKLPMASSMVPGVAQDHVADIKKVPKIVNRKSIGSEILSGIVHYVGNMYGDDLFETSGSYYKAKELRAVGIKLTRIGACGFVAKTEDERRLIRCPEHGETTRKTTILGRSVGEIGPAGES